MIVTEFYRTREDGISLYRTYSDIGMMIQQETGRVYSEAIDIEGAHTYTETTTPIEDELTDSEALNIIMGRDVYEPTIGGQVPQEN